MAIPTDGYSANSLEYTVSAAGVNPGVKTQITWGADFSAESEQIKDAVETALHYLCELIAEQESTTAVLYRVYAGSHFEVLEPPS